MMKLEIISYYTIPIIDYNYHHKTHKATYLLRLKALYCQCYGAALSNMFSILGHLEEQGPGF
jgi:hypothetical protein